MRTYACPFCSMKFNRYTLEKHLEKQHDKQIPPNITIHHFFYDIVNDIENGHGKCVVCGNPTNWNEKTQKYFRLCKNPQCKEEIRKHYKDNMLRVYNKVHLLDDPKHLEKMLAARRISGEYIWSDGTKYTYTGKQEKQLLIWLDQVMDYDSKDVLMPGPILKYNFKGKMHNYITDCLIIPWNLIIEVKDGGDNKNKNPALAETRAKTVAKEVMITNEGKYNYVRLTNCNYGQLLSIMAEMKQKVMDKDTSKTVRIHEDFFEYEYFCNNILNNLQELNNINITESNMIKESDDEELLYEFCILKPEDTRIDKRSSILYENYINNYLKDFLPEYNIRTYFVNGKNISDGIGLASTFE